jgi:hypothetical protein
MIQLPIETHKLAARSYRVLVGHEESQAVCKALRALGHEAYSCDLLDCSGGRPEWHLKMDVFAAIALGGWDAALFFPTCTYLCSSGLHWNKRVSGRAALTELAVQHVQALWACGISRISIENPIGCLSSRFQRPTQIIQPWQFGHPEAKATCLWLKGLPPLTPTKTLSLPACGYWKNQTPSGQNKLGPSKDRAKLRSKTYQGVAEAMAFQWFGACELADWGGLI